MKHNLIIENTSYCNQQCKFCPQFKYKLRNKIMPFKLFKNIIDSVKELGIQISHTTLSGMGEPFTDPGLFEKARYAVDTLGRPVELYTNGKALTEEKMIKASEIFFKFYLSIHGETPEEYEQYTGNTFEFIKNQAKMVHKIMGGRLSISNHPTGQLEKYLEVPVNKGASIHPMFNWGEEEIEKEIKAKKMHQKYCELIIGIVFRVDGSIGTCCSDWDNENDFLEEKFPHCEICSNKYIHNSAKESGALAKQIIMLKNLNALMDEKK